MTTTLAAPAGKTYSIVPSGNALTPWRLIIGDEAAGDFATCDRALAYVADWLRGQPKYADHAIAVIDTETTGTRIDDEVWEIGAILRDPTLGRDGDREFHLFVDHSLEKARNLPASFLEDHDRRYRADIAVSPAVAGRMLLDFLGGAQTKRVFLMGAVPSFDERMLRPVLEAAGTSFDETPPWHYRLQCVESYARGWLHGRGIHVPMTVSSDDLVAMTGFQVIDEKGVPIYERHIALDDTRWALDWYDHMRTN